MSQHGLTSERSDSATDDQNSTVDEEKMLLSSFMTEIDPSITTMKLPRNLSEPNGNDIIHSSPADGEEFQYKKEFAADILSKYGGVTKKNPSKTPKKQRKVSRKSQRATRFAFFLQHFAVSHPPHLISLYNHVRSSSGSVDTLPSMPMFEYELLSTIKALQSIEQSLEFYLNELSRRSMSVKNDEDSALDTFSSQSSFVEQIDRQISDEGYRSTRNEFEKRRRSIGEEQVEVWRPTMSNSSSSPSVV